MVLLFIKLLQKVLVLQDKDLLVVMVQKALHIMLEEEGVLHK